MKIKIQNDGQPITPNDEEIGADTHDDEAGGWPAGRDPIVLDNNSSIADAIAAASVVREASGMNGEDQWREPTEAALAAATSAELQDLKAKNEELNGLYRRALADVANIKRRSDEESSRITRDANLRLIYELLPTFDDFDLALAAAKQSESYEQLVGGVDAIIRKFRETLLKQGVEPIPSVGEKFDPDVHEAIMIDEASEEPDETVTAELRKGYTLHGRVIRPSLVKVAKAG